jgi:hypothetical protein
MSKSRILDQVIHTVPRRGKPVRRRGCAHPILAVFMIFPRIKRRIRLLKA